jgi:hypothetical protein
MQRATGRAGLMVGEIIRPPFGGKAADVLVTTW